MAKKITFHVISITELTNTMYLDTAEEEEIFFDKENAVSITNKRMLKNKK